MSRAPASAAVCPATADDHGDKGCEAGIYGSRRLSSWVSRIRHRRDELGCTMLSWWEVERVSLVRCRPWQPDASPEARGSQWIIGSIH